MYTSTQIQRRRERERNTKNSKRLFAIDERMHNGRNEYMCDSILSPTFDPRQIRSTISTRTNRQTKQKIHTFTEHCCAPTKTLEKKKK